MPLDEREVDTLDPAASGQRVEREDGFDIVSEVEDEV